MNCSLFHIESRRIFKIFGYIFFAYFLSADPLFFSSLDDLVVHIGKILDEFDLIPSVLEIFSHGVKHYERSGIAYVEVIVDGRTAHIHSYLSFFDRYKLFLFSRQSIINLHFYFPLSLSLSLPQRKLPAACFPE